MNKKACIILLNLLVASNYLSKEEQEKVTTELTKLAHSLRYRSHCAFKSETASSFLNMEEQDLSPVLLRLFAWSFTDMGDEFWRTLTLKIQSLENPDLKEKIDLDEEDFDIVEVDDL